MPKLYEDLHQRGTPNVSQRNIRCAEMLRKLLGLPVKENQERNEGHDDGALGICNKSNEKLTSCGFRYVMRIIENQQKRHVRMSLGAVKDASKTIGFDIATMQLHITTRGYLRIEYS